MGGFVAVPSYTLFDMVRGNKLVRRRNAGKMFFASLVGPIAQRLEQATHNRLVTGSNPVGPTTFGSSDRINSRKSTPAAHRDRRLFGCF